MPCTFGYMVDRGFEKCLLFLVLKSVLMWYECEKCVFGGVCIWENGVHLRRLFGCVFKEINTEHA